MVTIKLLGGLGNQMFEYAFGRNLALKNNSELKLNLAGLNNGSEQISRRYSLDVFNISATVFKKKSLATKLINKFFTTENYLKEANYTLEKLLNLKGNLYLEGFFQNPNYFKNIEEIIRKDFTLKPELADFNPALFEKIQNSNSVAIHVRRTDYLNNPEFNKTHGTLALPYYEKAIKIIQEKVSNPQFFIFSDDFEWCKNNLKIDNAIFVEGQKDYQDLITISKCHHQIIANSSFSWWGAWLNENPDKIVIAPKKWFADEKLKEQAKNLIPENWIRI